MHIMHINFHIEFLCRLTCHALINATFSVFCSRVFCYFIIFAAESPVPLLMEGVGVALIINTNRL